MQKKKMSRGALFRRRVLRDHDLNLSEMELLTEVAGILDLLEAGGLAVSEQRQQRTLLSKLIAQLQLPDDEGAPQVPTPTRLRGQAAARAKWDQAHAKEGGR